MKVGSIRMMARRERSEQGQQAGGTSAAPMAPICEAVGAIGLRYPRWGGRRDAVRLEKC